MSKAGSMSGDGGTFDRRRFLQLSAAGGAAVAGFPGLTGRDSLAALGVDLAAPRRGGTLRAGLTGGSSADTLDAHKPVSNTDNARVLQLYDPLVRIDHNCVPRLALAEHISPNRDATQWTIRLRSGLTFHNGKPVTADDVIYTIRRIANPKNPLIGRSFLGPIDLANLKKVDARTVRISMHSPFATFVESIAGFYNNLGIVPVDYNPKHPIGTGPFRAKSFQPGVQSEFVRNKNYWQSGLPYVDSVVINDIATEPAQVNALLAGQLDVVSLLSFTSIGQVTKGGAKAVVSKSGAITPFTMRVDAAPFSDVRVRQAMRYAVDREQMLSVVFGGHGTIGNDIFSIWDADYDHSIPQRPHDPEKAKSLLKAAGKEGLTVQLVTSEIAQGTVQAAQVIAQQAKSAGMKVQVRHLTVSDFFGPGYLKWRFAQDYWYYGPYLPQVSQETLPGATFNETHFNNPRYNKLYKQATSELNSKKRREIAHEMQRIDYTLGGLIIPYFAPVIDGHSAKVHGVVPSRTGFPLSDWEFLRFWLS